MTRFSVAAAEVEGPELGAGGARSMAPAGAQEPVGHAEAGAGAAGQTPAGGQPSGFPGMLQRVTPGPGLSIPGAALGGRVGTLERVSARLNKLKGAQHGPATGAHREREALGYRMGSLARISGGARAVLQGAVNPGSPDLGAGARGEGELPGNLDSVSMSTFVSPPRASISAAAALSAAAPPVTTGAPASPGPGASTSELGGEGGGNAGSPRPTKWGSPVKALAGLVAGRARLPPAPTMFEDLGGPA